VAESWWRFHALTPLQFRSTALLRHLFAVLQKQVQCLLLQPLCLALVPLSLLLLSLRQDRLLPVLGLFLEPLAILVELADALTLSLLLRGLPSFSFLSPLLLAL
jgi:hypothetical protein